MYYRCRSLDCRRSSLLRHHGLSIIPSAPHCGLAHTRCGTTNEGHDGTFRSPRFCDSPASRNRRRQSEPPKAFVLLYTIQLAARRVLNERLFMLLWAVRTIALITPACSGVAGAETTQAPRCSSSLCAPGRGGGTDARLPARVECRKIREYGADANETSTCSVRFRPRISSRTRRSGGPVL
jgi:hypothetical protein